MSVDWDQIKWVWLIGGDLMPLASRFGITIPEISLHAKFENWGERGADKPLIPDFDSPVLTDQMVMIAHKTDLGRLRLFAACVMEGMKGEKDVKIILTNTEKLAKIYQIIIPLERKVFGMDVGDDDAPDRVTISKTPVAK
jgi:hypothetical protein